MIDLNKEAEEYAKDFIEDKDLIELQIAAFLEGHNSKATQAKIIQAQIDVLDKYAKTYGLTSGIINFKKELEHQLKQLENE
jgi:hypothetical protein